jgi:tight adherence protein B
VTLVVFALGGPLVCVALVRAARRADSRAHSRLLQPVARWRLPARVRDPLAAALEAADVAVAPEAAVETWALALGVVGAMCAVVAPALLVPAIVAGVVGAPVALHLSRRRLEHRFAAALPGALEQVAAELRGGGSVASALERVAASDSPVAVDLRRVHTRTRLGLSLRDALAAWPIEHDAPGVRAAAGAFAVATSMGGHAADAIDALGSSIRHRLDAAAEAQSLSTQARLSAVVVGAAPLGYLVFASLVDARAVSALVGTGIGRVCLVVGLALEALAALWIRRIVTSEAR